MYVTSTPVSSHGTGGQSDIRGWEGWVDLVVGELPSKQGEEEGTSVGNIIYLHDMSRGATTQPMMRPASSY